MSKSELPPKLRLNVSVKRRKKDKDLNKNVLPLRRLSASVKRKKDNELSKNVLPQRKLNVSVKKRKRLKDLSKSDLLLRQRPKDLSKSV